MITGNRITTIGKTAGVSIPKDAQVIDATGKFLIPGLWDMHVHWYGYDKAYLQLFIVNGVTGVRVMWGAPVHFEWRKEIQEELCWVLEWLSPARLLMDQNQPGPTRLGSVTKPKDGRR